MGCRQFAKKVIKKLEYQLTEPHFDDERTLLTARRVVPLESVRTQSARRRRWLTATITVAAALGTLTATFAYYRRPVLSTNRPSFGRDAQVAVTGVIEEQPEFDIAAVPDESELEESPTVDESEVPATPPTVGRNKPRLQRSANVRPSDTEPVAVKDQAPSEDETNDRPVPRRVDRWEERRERRTERRHRSGGQTDLFRIDQIFEGAPKP